MGCFRMFIVCTCTSANVRMNILSGPGKFSHHRASDISFPNGENGGLTKVGFLGSQLSDQYENWVT